MTGVGVSKGVALGQAQWMRLTVLLPIDNTPINPSEISTEKSKFEDARQAALKQIRALVTSLRMKLPKEAEIFQAHALILEDEEFVTPVIQLIEQQCLPAGAAIYSITQTLKDTFLAMDNEYFQARAQDIVDIERRLILNLQGTPPVDLQLLEPGTILLAEELTPSETAGLNTEKVIGLATRLGGKTSHTAILAKALGIPAVVGCSELEQIQDGDQIIINGDTGEILVNPSSVERQSALNAQKLQQEREIRFAAEVKLPTETLDRHQLTLAANLSHPGMTAEAIKAGAEEVGLFRTEFLYLGRDSAPSEEEQFQVYKTVVEGMAGRPVIFRTMDIGGDKQVPYLGLAEEDNPFLGYRALRICLQEPELFSAQIRAILRTSAFGPVKIMFPMVATLDELDKATAIVKCIGKELACEGIPSASAVPLGIMIEIPSAALRAAEFAAEVDFFSIGTNDLIQYTLAADRLNPKLSSLYQACDPAVLRLIAGVIEAGRKRGIPVGVCGEMASQPLGALLLLGMGINELSMSIGSLPEIKSLIRRTVYSEAARLVQSALRMRTTQEVQMHIQEYLNGH
ncbi:phosphoenolpyruvate--protein phosphotransferase [Desulfosporosinus sp. SB140]|uniref:phosphoenolpyruvate--protein phosphotransferase n=1 Tax=Desulfosporosinus paludis TaxID=3115649 RepID=UPI00388F6BB4